MTLPILAAAVASRIVPLAGMDLPAASIDRDLLDQARGWMALAPTTIGSPCATTRTMV
jgi:hypothetical protein